MHGVSPADLGLPPKFQSFRDQQTAMIDNGLASTRRFVAHAMPTGAGKSAAAIAEARYRGARVCVLTSTKALQNQYLDDFSPAGLRSVKGRANFQCLNRPGMSCEDGGHCGCTNSQCPYKHQHTAAKESGMVVTNYAYWCAINQFGEGLGTFDLLVLDEAHDAPDEVSSQMSVALSSFEAHQMLTADWPARHNVLADWKEWAASAHETASRRLAQVMQNVRVGALAASADNAKVIARWKSLAAKLSTVAHMSGAWVVEPRIIRNEQDGWRLEAVWPRAYAESILFCGVPKVMLLSATLNRKTLDLLGIKPQQADYYEYPAVFEPSRSPVYYVPTVKLNYKATDADYAILVSRIDEILSTRQDRKGIIHTTSYSRAQMLLGQSKYASAMLLPDSRSTAGVVRMFKDLPPPLVLVSPAVTTGYDFPMEHCEYQIIMKAPYPDLRSRIQQRRIEEDRLYPSYTMAQTLVQAAGRGMRSEQDRCETFVLDDTAAKVMKSTPYLFPAWFRRLWHETANVPPPGPRV